MWKLITNEGDDVDADTVIAILEAMKLEINVRGEDNMGKGRVEKVLVRPGDVVQAGDPLVLIRKD